MMVLGHMVVELGRREQGRERALAYGEGEDFHLATSLLPPLVPPLPRRMTSNFEDGHCRPWEARQCFYAHG
jgi:hypothetical protein